MKNMYGKEVRWLKFTVECSNGETKEFSKEGAMSDYKKKMEKKGNTCKVFYEDEITEKKEICKK